MFYDWLSGIAANVYGRQHYLTFVSKLKDVLPELLRLFIERAEFSLLHSHIGIQCI